MANSENNNSGKSPKIKKTSDSVTSTLPRLCPTTKHDTKDIRYNIPEQSLKSRSLGNRPISDESKKRPSLIRHSKTNLQKSKLTEAKYSGDPRFKGNVSLTFISHCDYRGRIPVPHKHSLNLLAMSLPITRSSSPSKKSSPKDKTTTAATATTTNKVKTITFDQNVKKKNRTGCSRSPSPAKKTPAQASYKKPRPMPGSSIVGSKAFEKSSITLKRIEGKKLELISPRLSSPKRKSKTKVPSASYVEVYSKSKASMEANRPLGDSEPVVLKQASQPSLCKNDLMIQPQEKISLDHLKNEVYLGDHKRLSIEEVHLCIEKSLESGNVGSSTRSYVVTYSSEDLKSNSMSFLQSLSNSSIKTYKTEPVGEESEEKTGSKSAIRTLSGHELVLTPSMKLEMEKADVESDDFEISELLHETVDDSEEPKEIQMLQDDANEYDSEMSTEEDASEEEEEKKTKVNEIEVRKSVSKCDDDLQMKSSQYLWRKREAELSNDVDYRQSVYHPAVSRRHKEDHGDKDFRPKSKSIEDNYGYVNKTTEGIVRSLSSNLRHKFTPQTFTVDKIDGTNSDQSWGSMFNQNQGKTIYKPIIHDVPMYTALKGMKRIRTKKERISGALLRITLKIIRLLAIFNLWPGDNCYMMTSQSLRFAR